MFAAWQIGCARGRGPWIVDGIGSPGRARPSIAWRVGLITFVLAATCEGASVPNAQGAGTPLSTSIPKTYDAGSIYQMPYRLFLPPDLATSSEEFPLVIFLHGAGERGTNNVDQVSTHIGGLWNAVRSPDYEAFLIAPQMTDAPGAGGWSPLSPYDRTLEIVDAVIAQYPQVDTNRIYLTGLSMGGYGTFTYLQYFPDLFAAAVPMSGGGNPSKAYLYKDEPIWVFHGSADATVPVSQSQAMVAALKAAGGSPLYTEIPGAGHNIWDVVYADGVLQQYGLYDWMFAQTLAVPEPATWSMAAMAAAAVAVVGLRTRRKRPKPTESAVPAT